MTVWTKLVFFKEYKARKPRGRSSDAHYDFMCRSLNLKNESDGGLSFLFVYGF